MSRRRINDIVIEAVPLPQVDPVKEENENMYILTYYAYPILYKQQQHVGAT